MINQEIVIQALMLAGQDSGPGKRAIIEVNLNDPRLDLSWLYFCDDGGIPSLPQGQEGSCRLKVPNAQSGLHVHFNESQGWLRFHLDVVDPIENIIGHVFADTRARDGLVIGGVIGLAMLAAKVHPMIAMLTTAFGVGIGSSMDSKTPRFYTFNRIDRDGQWSLARIPPGPSGEFAPA